MKIFQGAEKQAIENVVRHASNRVGVDFGYLYKTALRESSLNPTAKASTSTASGLFQFIDQTWLQTVKEDGPRLGYGNVAKHIYKMTDGTYDVPNAKLKRKILNLRFDPQMSSTMAAAFTHKNKIHLAQTLGRNPTQGELYIAHFMGANGAEDLIKAAARNPNANAVAMFPSQAKSNKPIFYNNGHPKSVLQVYQSLSAKHMNTGAPKVQPARQNTLFMAQMQQSNQVNTAPPKRKTLLSLFSNINKTDNRPVPFSAQIVNAAPIKSRTTGQLQAQQANQALTYTTRNQAKQPVAARMQASNLVTGYANNTNAPRVTGTLPTPQKPQLASPNTQSIAPNTQVRQQPAFNSLYSNLRSTQGATFNTTQAAQANTQLINPSQLVQNLRPSNTRSLASPQVNARPVKGHTMEAGSLGPFQPLPAQKGQGQQAATQGSLFNLLFSNKR